MTEDINRLTSRQTDRHTKIHKVVAFSRRIYVLAMWSASEDSQPCSRRRGQPANQSVMHSQPASRSQPCRASQRARQPASQPAGQPASSQPASTSQAASSPRQPARASSQPASWPANGVVLLGVALLYESPAETRLTVYRRSQHNSGLAWR